MAKKWEFIYFMATKTMKTIQNAFTKRLPAGFLSQEDRQLWSPSMAAEAHNPMHGPTMSCQAPHKPRQ